MFKTIACSLAIAALGVVWCYVIRSVVRKSRRIAAVRKRAKEIMRDRQALSSTAFGSELFPQHEAEIAARLREILKRVLIVDVTRIHPDDRLVEDLGLGQVDGLDPNFLEGDIEREFGVGLTPAWSSIKTVRDLVTYVSSHCSVAK